MRYFEFTINLQVEDLKSEKVRLKDYSYDSPVDAVAYYLFQKLTNGVTYLTYRVDNTGMKSVIAIDEKTRAPEEAVAEVTGILDDILVSKVTADEPFEITMLDFDDKMSEARRRGFVHNWGKLCEQANLIMYEDREYIQEGKAGFKLDEMVARPNDGKSAKGNDHLYDVTLKDELVRISADKVTPEKGKRMPGDTLAIPAHYVISARSKEAGSDIAARLMSALAAAGRLPGGRLELFTDIDEDLYKHNLYFERIIDNSFGGTIVLDMTAKFGVNPAEYGLTCEYLARLIRQRKNSNLFVFLYDIDNPGFAYNLITRIEKSIYLINIREGSGTFKAAERYLKSLVKGTDFSSYAGQTGEYLKTLPLKRFTQTDVINAFDNFESWCMRKNFLKSYNLESETGFKIDRDTDNLTASEQLEKMIGLKAVKEQIERVIMTDKVEKQRTKHGSKGRAMHMIFAGNPGTAKTVVAGLFAQIAKEHGILKSGTFVERAGMQLSGMFATLAIREAFDEADGGVLFIDEAYSMCGDNAITALIREMEARRNDVIVIFAGYEDRMKRFIELNEGLKSRIPYTVKFPDYTPDELLQIYDYILAQGGYTATAGAKYAAREIFEKAVKVRNFGNGRYARVLAEKSTLNMSVRLAKKYGDREIPKSLLYKVCKDDVFNPDDTIVNCNNGECKAGKNGKERTAREELEAMIGLESAKQVINGAIATFKMQKLLRKRGVNLGSNAMHMAFLGNPGTAKTTVARLLARILKDEGVLSTGVFVEAGRADLVAPYVGQTAPLVRRKFDDANGGVLFIDEAYSLSDDRKGCFGDEAINTIVQEMDNRREDTIVIFAGYPDEMKAFIERNPGMSSRLAFRVNFEDYTVEQLCEITRFQVASKHLHITDDAVNALVPIYETALQNKTYGNGRYARRCVELAISNLALRLDKMDEEDLTDKVLTTIEACDIAAPELDAECEKPKRRIGFVA